jgi:hypothetical protein
MGRANGRGTVCRACGDGPRSRGVGLVVVVAVAAAAWNAAAQEPPRSAKAESTRLLLERLDERRMPDVVLWVLDRLEQDPEAPADLKAEAAYRRAVALVGVSRRESDAAKRAGLFDEAQKQLDRFLEGSVTGDRAVDGFTQKGNLLIERGRAKLDEARRPGADAPALRAQGVSFFDAAIQALEGTVKSKDDPLPEKITTAEDAVVREFRAVSAEIEALKTGGGEDAPAAGKRPGRRPGSAPRRRDELEAQLETWQGKLVQTRLMVASAWYEKSRAFEPQSEDWKKALEQSTERFKAIAEKYPTLGGGFFARAYEGRNLAALAKYDDAISTLAPLVTLQGQSGLASLLRRKALATTVECWVNAKKFGELTPDQRKMALATVPPAQLDEDWLALKLRVAQLLEAQAGAVGEKEKTKARPMLQDAKKLALEVNRANREFAAEARDLLGRIGADVPDVASDKTFAAAMDEARQAVAVMQQAAAEAKATSDAAATSAAIERGAAARSQATAAVRDALRRTADTEIDAVNQARYLLTYLLYDAGRYHDAATLGRFLAERYPNTKGSRQAATIAMASWQQLQKKQPDPGWREDAKAKGAAMAERIMRIWSDDTEAGDAALVALQSVINARDPQALVEFVAKTPATSPRRADVLLGAGAALWREALEQRKREGGEAAANALKQQAVVWLDEGLVAAGSLKPSATTVGGALARCQIARDDGDTKLAVRWLEDPRHGPWTVAQDPQADAAVREGPFAEAAVGVALRCFVEADALDKAQQAMTRLEQLAGEGQESTARLTAMYFAMGQELQGELEGLARDGGGDRAQARARARSILAGFEKFLDGVAKRDARVASQIWVASTYLTLGSGAGTGAVVPAAEAAKYLDRSSAVFDSLLARKGEPEVAKFEPALRLKMAEIHSARGRWTEAEEQIDWLLADKRRQNTPDLQMQAARILQSAGERLATSDPAAAEEKLRQAAVGRTAGESVVWGWGGVANRLSRQVSGSDDERTRKARDQFFEARLNLAACLVKRAMLPGKSAAEKQEQLAKAADSIDVTRRLYPDLGGKAFTERFERLLKEIEKERG